MEHPVNMLTLLPVPESFYFTVSGRKNRLVPSEGSQSAATLSHTNIP